MFVTLLIGVSAMGESMEDANVREAVGSSGIELTYASRQSHGRKLVNHYGKGSLQEM